MLRSITTKATLAWLAAVLVLVASATSAPAAWYDNILFGGMTGEYTPSEVRTDIEPGYFPSYLNGPGISAGPIITGRRNGYAIFKRSPMYIIGQSGGVEAGGTQIIAPILQTPHIFAQCDPNTTAIHSITFDRTTIYIAISYTDNISPIYYYGILKLTPIVKK